MAIPDFNLAALLLLEKMRIKAPEVLVSLWDDVFLPHCLPLRISVQDIDRLIRCLGHGDLADVPAPPTAESFVAWANRYRLVEPEFPDHFKKYLFLWAVGTAFGWARRHKHDKVELDEIRHPGGEGSAPLWAFESAMEHEKKREEAGEPPLATVSYRKMIKFEWTPSKGGLEGMIRGIRHGLKQVEKDAVRECEQAHMRWALEGFKKRRGVTERHFEWLVLVHILGKEPGDVGVEYGESDGSNLSVEAVYKGMKRASEHLRLPYPAIRKGKPGRRPRRG